MLLQLSNTAELAIVKLVYIDLGKYFFESALDQIDTIHRISAFFCGHKSEINQDNKNIQENNEKLNPIVLLK